MFQSRQECGSRLPSSAAAGGLPLDRGRTAASPWPAGPRWAPPAPSPSPSTGSYTGRAVVGIFEETSSILFTTDFDRDSNYSDKRILTTHV